ncbi:hypothetical protein pdam_00011533 [Pocillopora damicornis]|uniref:Uncharacterized protein n=1 Tax=Pocillopora damicornis TaxID=46731 RepID=A0A3M6UM51_POCDA|nr:hypothetical protein pdam_00011533 [Pocillopora damicornis]
MAFLKALKKQCLHSFLLSPLQLVEIKIRGSERWKIRRCTAGLRTTLQIICVNCVFLGLRMIDEAFPHSLRSFSYKCTVSITIAFQTAVRHIMASFSTFLRRVAFLGLITIQSILLSAYLAKYDGKYSWYFITFSFGSAVVAWIVCLYFKSLYLG